MALTINTSNQGGLLTGVSTSSSTVSSNTPESSSPSQSPTSNQHSTHLSSGAISGIAIGGAAVIIVVIMLAMVAIFQHRRARDLQASLEHRHDQVYPWPAFPQPEVGSSPQMSHHDSSDLAHRMHAAAPRVYSGDSAAYELDVRERSAQDQDKSRVAPTATEET